jgi:hypothetical protein
MKGNGVSMGCCSPGHHACASCVCMHYQRRGGIKEVKEREQEKGDKALGPSIRPALI